MNMKCTKCKDNSIDLSIKNLEVVPQNTGHLPFRRRIAPEPGYEANPILEEQIMKLISKKMIKVGENCFPVIDDDENKITFNISEINSEIIKGNCFMFNLAIYSNTSKCIEKPENTYYVNNEENTGVIKNCSEACKSCNEGYTTDNTKCLECADGYSHL